jgi:hypothetical protein
LEPSCLIVILRWERSQLSTHGNDDYTMIKPDGKSSWQNDKCEDFAVVDLPVYLTR